jgi:hypothetical protein
MSTGSPSLLVIRGGASQGAATTELSDRVEVAHQRMYARLIMTTVPHITVMMTKTDDQPTQFHYPQYTSCPIRRMPALSAASPSLWL